MDVEGYCRCGVSMWVCAHVCTYMYVCMRVEARSCYQVLSSITLDLSLSLNTEVMDSARLAGQ